MLNPRPITDAIAAALAAIPDLAAAMTVGELVRISAFHYDLGAEVPLVEAVYKMPAPSVLVAFEGTQGGNFNGYQIWKHRFGVYFRGANMAGNGAPLSYEDLWWLTCNGVPTGSTVNIRYMNLVSGLDIMDTPSITHLQDEDQIDVFKGVFTIPEIGDE